MINHSEKIHGLRNAYLSARGKTKFRKATIEAGEETLRWWAMNFLDKHFETGSYQRYLYAARTEVWNKIKRRKSVMSRGRMIILEQPPKPLVFSGDMRRWVLSRKGSMNIKGSAGMYEKLARGGKGFSASVTAAVTIPHPVNPKNKGEVKRLIPDEWRKMSWMWFTGIRERMRNVRRSDTNLYKG